ncbi:MAG: DUF4157 domain-containing protein, partial [Myxococcales bacterium]|nr:DUF4157 domain-containing protein [Myxococcales bacterium]
MDRLRRGDSTDEARDRQIELRAIRLVRAGRDWLTAMAEATRQVQEEELRAAGGEVSRRGPGGRRTPGKRTRSAALDALPALARQARGAGADDLELDLDAGVLDAGDLASGRPSRPDPGQPLPASLRAELAELLGVDLDAVRVHTGPASAEAAAAIAVSAFTIGRDIHFAAGSFQPDTEAGRQLITREVAQAIGRPDAARAAGEAADGEAATPGSLERALALLADPRIPAGFAQQAAVAHALRAAGAGEGLDAGVQDELGDRVGVPLGEVRVHRDPVSTRIVEALGARAFAFGRHLFFGPGAYSPENDQGRALIAHELAHVAQQPRGDRATPAGRIALGAEGDQHEREADVAASHLLAGLRPTVRPAPVAARFDKGGSVDAEGVLRKHIGQDEGKAKEALSKAGAKRGMVERIIRGAFEKERAEEIIKGAPAGGGGEKAPTVEKAGAAKAGKVDAEAGKGAQSKTDSAVKGGGAKGGGAKLGKGGGPMGDMLDGLGINELTPDQRDLIATELAEHQAWSAASAAVGAPGSWERAGFIAEQFGRGFAQGAATGAVMGVVMGTVSQLAQRFCPIPGVGAMIAGGMAAYGLATRDWKATAANLAAFGTGSSKWEVMANSLGAISEFIDLVVNIMNVIAGIIGLVSAVMWLVTILTAGVASPLAGTLSAIALGIVTVSGVLDNINNLVLQPAVIACRAMHMINSDADPREIVGQGAKLADSASKVGAAVGGFVAGRAVSAGAKGIDRRLYGPGGRPGARPAAPSKPTATARPAAADAPASRPSAAPDAPASRPSAA